MGKAPAFQFYVKDWLTDTQLRKASPHTRGIWIDILCYMWVAPDRGELTGDFLELQQIIGTTKEQLTRFLVEACALDFCYVSVTDNDNIILRNRRMWREHKDKENNRLRQRRFRNNRKGNANVTPPSPSPSPKKKINKRKKLLPNGFNLTSDHKGYANKLGIEASIIPSLFEEFCLYHQKMGSQFVSWDAAFKTWMRNHVNWKKEKEPDPGYEDPRTICLKCKKSKALTDGLCDQCAAARI